MQTLIQVICNHKQKGSLREAIANDKRLKNFELFVSKQKDPERPIGWAKIHSTENKRGAINITWDGQTRVLECRVITKLGNKPNEIIGDFLNYLLKRHYKKIKVINLFP